MVSAHSFKVISCAGKNHLMQFFLMRSNLRFAGNQNFPVTWLPCLIRKSNTNLHVKTEKGHILRMNLHASLLLNEALQWHQHVLIEADMLFHWWILHRGLAPQNKPELQKVLEKRKRDQVLKQQKEEQEAHKKRSDLEIELMKRQQKLEQVNDW